LRRLFTTYASGLPGAGLLVMRLVTGIALGNRAIVVLRGETSVETTLARWSPLRAFFCSQVWAHLLGERWWLWSSCGTASCRQEIRGFTFCWERSALHWHCFGLALVVDAHLFGWQRIDDCDRRRDRTP
jgi:hypothetical protein